MNKLVILLSLFIIKKLLKHEKQIIKINTQLLDGDAWC